jgi:chitinase
MASNPFNYCLLWLIALIGLAAPLSISVPNGNDTGCRTQSNIVAATENSSEVNMEGGYKSIAYFVNWVSISLVFRTNPIGPS